MNKPSCDYLNAGREMEWVDSLPDTNARTVKGLPSPNETPTRSSRDLRSTFESPCSPSNVAPPNSRAWPVKLFAQRTTQLPLYTIHSSCMFFACPPNSNVHSPFANRPAFSLFLSATDSLSRGTSFYPESLCHFTTELFANVFFKLLFFFMQKNFLD